MPKTNILYYHRCNRSAERSSSACMVYILQESNWDHTRCSSKVSETSFEGQFGQGFHAIGNLKMKVIRMVDGGRCQLPIRLGYYVFNKWVCLDTNWRFPYQKSDAGIGQLILGGAKHCNLKTWRIDACKSCKRLLWESENVLDCITNNYHE